jgi:hypothetical protein
MELEEFLVKAKQATYANASVEKVAASRRGSNDYEYSENGMIYHDTFLVAQVLWVRRSCMKGILRSRFGE